MCVCVFLNVLKLVWNTVTGNVSNIGRKCSSLIEKCLKVPKTKNLEGVGGGG